MDGYRRCSPDHFSIRLQLDKYWIITPATNVIYELKWTITGVRCKINHFYHEIVRCQYRLMRPTNLIWSNPGSWYLPLYGKKWPASTRDVLWPWCSNVTRRQWVAIGRSFKVDYCVFNLVHYAHSWFQEANSVASWPNSYKSNHRIVYYFFLEILQSTFVQCQCTQIN